MSTISTVATPEKGTRVITLAPTDEDGNALAFGDLISPVWSLTTRRGTVINERDSVALTSLVIVLTGADLAIVDEDTTRILTIEATYDSDAGTGLNLKEQYVFPIEDLVKVS